MEFLKSKEQVIAERLGSVNEGATKYGDVWKVKSQIEIPKSLINAFISKAKKENNIDPREQWGDADLAEMFVTYIAANFINIESLPVQAILGDQMKSAGEVQTTVQPGDVAQPAQPAQPAEGSQPVQPVQTQPVQPVQAQTQPAQGDVQTSIENQQ